MSRHTTTASAVASLAAILLVAGPVHALSRPGPAVQPSAVTLVAAGPGCVLPAAPPRPERGPLSPGGPMRAY